MLNSKEGKSDLMKLLMNPQRLLGSVKRPTSMVSKPKMPMIFPKKTKEDLKKETEK
jgi:hypothetical protein